MYFWFIFFCRIFKKVRKVSDSAWFFGLALESFRFALVLDFLRCWLFVSVRFEYLAILL